MGQRARPSSPLVMHMRTARIPPYMGCSRSSKAGCISGNQRSLCRMGLAAQSCTRTTAPVGMRVRCSISRAYRQVPSSSSTCSLASRVTGTAAAAGLPNRSQRGLLHTISRSPHRLACGRLRVAACSRQRSSCSRRQACPHAAGPRPAARTTSLELATATIIPATCLAVR